MAQSISRLQMMARALINRALRPRLTDPYNAASLTGRKENKSTVLQESSSKTREGERNARVVPSIVLASSPSTANEARNTGSSGDAPDHSNDAGGNQEAPRGPSNKRSRERQNTENQDDAAHPTPKFSHSETMQTSGSLPNAIDSSTETEHDIKRPASASGSASYSDQFSDYAHQVERAYESTLKSASETLESIKNSLSTTSAQQMKDAGDKIYQGVVENVEQIVKKYVPMTNDGREIRPRSEFEHPEQIRKQRNKIQNNIPASLAGAFGSAELRRRHDNGRQRSLAHDQYDVAEASRLYLEEQQTALNQQLEVAENLEPSQQKADDESLNKVPSTATALLQQFYQLQAQLHAHIIAQTKSAENPNAAPKEDDAENTDRENAPSEKERSENVLPGSGGVGQNFIERLALVPLSLQMLSGAAATGFKFSGSVGSTASQTLAAAAHAAKRRLPSQRQRQAAEEFEKSKAGIRARIMARRPIDRRTRALVESLATSQSTLSRLHRVEQLSQHLLKFPEAKYEAVRENVVSCLLQFLHDAQGKDDGDGLVIQLHQCLALVGYAFPPRSAGIRILSIDGGGARGVIALELLCDLERRTGKPCHKLFDIMVGVSAGSIIVSALGLYKYSAEETLEIYRQIARELFTRNRIWGVGQLVWSHSYYDTSHYEESLRKLTGERLMIDFIESERSPKVAIVSSVLGPVNHGPQVAPYIFRNYNIPTGRLAMHEGACSHKVWQAIRASSAATGLFRELHLDGRIHQDGGILANNPSAIAIHEAHQIWGKNSRIQALVSVGNGKFLPSHGVYDNETMKILGNATLRSKLGSIVASATDTEAVHQLLLDLLPAKQYFRLNPRLQEDFPIDVSDPVIIEAMLNDARGFVRDNAVLLGQVSQSIDMPRPIPTMVSDMVKVWRDRTRKVETGIWYRAPTHGGKDDGLLQSEAPLGERFKSMK